MGKHKRLTPEQEQGGGNVPMVLLSEEGTRNSWGGARLGDDGNIRHLEYL